MIFLCALDMILSFIHDCYQEEPSFRSWSFVISNYRSVGLGHAGQLGLYDGLSEPERRARGAGGHVLPCPPSFWQIRKIYIKGGRLCPRNYYLSPEFSNLPTAMPWLALKLIANHIRCPTSHCEKQTSVLHITSIRLVVHLMLLYAHQLQTLHENGSTE